MTKIDCLFEFKCERHWEELEDIELKDLPQDNCFGEIRFCSECKKNVYKVKSKRELDQARQSDYCVAIPEILAVILEIPKSNKKNALKNGDIDHVSIGVLKK